MFDGARELLARYGEAFSAAWRRRHQNPASARLRGEADFLPAMLEIQEKPPHPLARVLVYLILTLFLLALFWMIIGRIDIVAVAPGKVLPDNRIKIIQAAQGGVVKAVYAKDGDIVSVGDLLLELDSTANDADEAKIKGELIQLRLEAEAARLLTESDKADAPPSLFSKDAPPQLLALQQRAMDNAFYEHRGRLRQIAEEISSLSADLAVELQGKEDALRQREDEKKMTEQNLRGEAHQLEKLRGLLPIAKSEMESYGRLYDEGAVSRLRLQGAKEKHISLRQDLRRKESEIDEIKIAGEVKQTALWRRAQQHESRADSLRAKVAGRQQALAVEKNRFPREMGERRAALLRRIGELEQSLVQNQNADSLHRITAPAAGVVQQAAIHTKGAVVQAAQALLVIVPQKSVLEVEAFVANKDIGFVRVGQTAEIKVDAFPYSKYGLLAGVVSRISADAIEDESRGLVYQAKIRLNEDSLIVNGEKTPVSPGMSVLAEIKTGRRRVIEFFLAPLIQHGKESLGER